MEGQEKTQRGV